MAKNHSTGPDLFGNLPQKQCISCKAIKPISEFYPTRAGANLYGVMSRCKECAKEARKVQHVTNKSKLVSGETVYPPETIKQCSRCKEGKVIAEFACHPTGRFAKQSRCRTCAHELQKVRVNKNRKQYREMAKRNILKKQFGLTMEEYQAMHDAQQGLCALCGNPETDLNNSRDAKSVRLLSVDHSHLTGSVRGLLCSMCNKGLGLLRDSPALLRKAADYIERYGG